MAEMLEMKAVRLEVDENDYARLKEVAGELDRPMSYIARLAVREWLDARGAKARGPRGKARGPKGGK